MEFRITGIDPEPFARYFEMTDDELAACNAVCKMVDQNPGFPCRVSLDDLPLGDRAVLVNFEHLPLDTPFRSRHAIYVGASSQDRFDRTGQIPPALARRLLSIRAFSADGLMIDAEIAEGNDVQPLIERFFAQQAVSFLHAHYARRGCYAARIDRV